MLSHPKGDVHFNSSFHVLNAIRSYFFNGFVGRQGKDNFFVKIKIKEKHPCVFIPFLLSHFSIY